VNALIPAIRYNLSFAVRLSAVAKILRIVEDLEFGLFDGTQVGSVGSSHAVTPDEPSFYIVSHRPVESALPSFSVGDRCQSRLAPFTTSISVAADHRAIAPVQWRSKLAGALGRFARQRPVPLRERKIVRDDKDLRS